MQIANVETSNKGDFLYKKIAAHLGLMSIQYYKIDTFSLLGWNKLQCRLQRARYCTFRYNR